MQPSDRTKLKAAAEATLVDYGDWADAAKDKRTFRLLATPETVLDLIAKIEALESRVASAEGALRLFLKYNDADTSDVSTMLAYDDALCAARAHFQSQGGDHGRD